MSSRTTATTANPIKLTFDRKKGLFKKCVGTKLGEDGKVRARIFWLGRVQHEALQKAKIYGDVWDELRDAGEQHWTPEREQEAEELIKRAANWARLVAEAASQRIDATLVNADRLRQMANPHAPSLASERRALMFGDEPAPAPAAPKASKQTTTLHAAVDAYTEALKTMKMAQNYRVRANECMGDLKARRDDVPLEQIDFMWLKLLVEELKSRPKSKRTGKAMSPYTAKTLAQHYRQFFAFIDDCSDSDRFGGWEAPRKFDKVFRFRPSDLMTPTELRAASTIQQFDLKTLRKLYAAASDHQRAVMLTAIFTGGTQMELAVLEKSEFDLAKATLHHFRNKTSVEGRLWLPPELVKLLKESFADRPNDHLAFRTHEGLPLVTFKNGTKASDSVRQFWDDLRVSAKVPDALSFKYLRKFLGDYMTRHGGDSVGQVALSHSHQTILGKHYTSARDFGTFNKLQRKMHAELKRAKVFSGTAED